MKLVIIESPYKGDVGRNKRYLRSCIRDCINVWGESPYASHRMLTDALDDNDTIERALGIGAGLAWRNAVDMSLGGGTRVLPIFYIDLGWSSGMLQAKARYDEEGILYRERRLPENDPFFGAHAEHCPHCGGVDIEVTIEDRCSEKRAQVECLGCRARGPGATRSEVDDGDWDAAEALALVRWRDMRAR